MTYDHSQPIALRSQIIAVGTVWLAWHMSSACRRCGGTCRWDCRYDARYTTAREQLMGAPGHGGWVGVVARLDGRDDEAFVDISLVIFIAIEQLHGVWSSP